jgi:hypothetical protein
MKRSTHQSLLLVRRLVKKIKLNHPRCVSASWIKHNPSNTTLFTMFNKTLIIRIERCCLRHLIIKVLLNIVNSFAFEGLFLFT